MLRRVFLCAVVVGCVFASDLTRAAIVNGDFETGDLTGWTVDLYGATAAASVQPVSSGFAAVLTGAPTEEGASGGDESAYAAISQTFTLSEPATVAVDVIGEYTLPLGEDGFAGAMNFSAHLYKAGAVSPLVYLINFGLGYPGESHSDTFSQTLSAVIPAGAYKIDASAYAANPSGGGGSNIRLVLDNFRVLAVPEPSALALLVMAACALPLMARRFRR